MEFAANRQRLSESDRLGVTTFGSLLVHMLVILGVTFAVPKLRELQGLPTLEITLVQSQSERAPERAEFLAQANQDGGGDSDRPDISRNPLPLREVSDVRNNFPAIRPKPQAPVQGSATRASSSRNRTRSKVSRHCNRSRNAGRRASIPRSSACRRRPICPNAPD